MKKLLVLALAGLFMASCGSDDNGDSNIGDCSPPTNFQESVAFPVAFINWDQMGAPSCILEYGVSGFTLGTGTQITSTDLQATISNLEAGTSYDYYISARCAADNVSAFIGPETFTTPQCEVITSAQTIFIDEDTIVFDYFPSPFAGVEVEYGTPGFTVGNGTIVRDANAFGQIEINNLTAGTTYDFYFRSICGSTLSDNSMVFTASTLSNCVAPSQFSGSAGSPGRVNLFWSDEGESAWRVEYGLSGFPLGSGTEINTSQTSISIDGLQSGQTYEFYVQANCGSEGFSSFTGPLPVVPN